jgi:hypothetical protein
MKNEFTPYDRSLKLKQLGFEDECMAYYEISVTEVEHEEDGTSGPFGWKQGEVSFEKRFFVNNLKGVDHTNDNWVCAAAPTWRSAFNWFREKYEYCSYIKEATKGSYRFYIEKFDEKFFNSDIIKTYEEAELACLDKLIEIVESKK